MRHTKARRFAACNMNIQYGFEICSKQVERQRCHYDFAHRNDYDFERCRQHEYQYTETVPCKLHPRGHEVTVVYVRNPRDIDIKVWFIDGERKWWTML
jgi:hypothetical protein